MEEYLIRKVAATNLPGITDLANQYVFEKLSAADRETGFLTGKFDLPAMHKMVASATSVVTLYQQEIVGFVINSALPFGDYPPLVQTLAQKIGKLYYKGVPITSYSYFYYGPVLVSKLHQGKGLLSRMFVKTKELLRGRYETGIVFIHEQNHHSLKVHTERLGLEILGQFSFGGDNYYILAFTV